MNRMIHSLVGYSRATDRVAKEFDVPDAVLSQAKELAGVPDHDPEVVMCYPLDAAGAVGLADLIGATVDPEEHDYFLEGHANEVMNDNEVRSDAPGRGIGV